MKPKVEAGIVKIELRRSPFRDWLANKLWKLAYAIHSYPPKFQEEIAREFLTNRREARKYIRKINDYMYATIGLI